MRSKTVPLPLGRNQRRERGDALSMLCFTCNTFQDFQWKFLIHMTKERVVIVPGNGRGDVEHSNWYGWLKKKLLEVSLPEEFGLQTYVFIR